MEQLQFFINAVKDLHLKRPFLFQMDEVESLRQRFQEVLSVIRTMNHRDQRDRLELLQRQLKENHVNCHLVSRSSELLDKMLENLSESETASNKGLVLMERLGRPWENPLIQRLKNECPSVTVHEISPRGFNVEELKNLSRSAPISITTADLLVSETGSLILTDQNRLRGVLTTTPRRHVVIAPVTRVIFSFKSGIDLVGKILRVRTGKIDAHVHVISNPSRTGDIEKIIVYGAHGPLALDVYLVDCMDGITLADHDLLMLKQFSGLLEFILIQAIPWLEETSCMLDIPCLDVVSISWFLAQRDKRKFWQHFFLLSLLRRFLTSNGFSITDDLLQKVVDACHGMITDAIMTSEMIPSSSVLKNVENQLELLFNEVFEK